MSTLEEASGATTPAGGAVPAERVPLATKLAAGSGEGAINIGVNIPANFSFLVYNLGLAVSPTLLGVALFLPRIWDAVIDPVMGSVSDNSTSRFGRRKPFMLIGALLSIVGIFAICYVPGGIDDRPWAQTQWGPTLSFGFATLDLHVPLRDWVYAGFLTVVCIVFYTCLTVFAVPYGALTMELTSDYEERTRVMSFRTLFTYLTGLFMAWLYPIVKASEDARTGAVVVGAILAALLAVIMLAPTFLVPERTKRREAGGGVEDVRRGPKVGIWRSVATTLKQPILLMIVAAYTVGFLGVIMVVKLGLYVAIFHIYGGGEAGETAGAYMQGWAQTLAILMGPAHRAAHQPPLRPGREEVAADRRARQQLHRRPAELVALLAGLRHVQADHPALRRPGQRLVAVLAARPDQLLVPPDGAELRPDLAGAGGAAHHVQQHDRRRLRPRRARDRASAARAATGPSSTGSRRWRSASRCCSAGRSSTWSGTSRRPA